MPHLTDDSLSILAELEADAAGIADPVELTAEERHAIEAELFAELYAMPAMPAMPAPADHEPDGDDEFPF